MPRSPIVPVHRPATRAAAVYAGAALCAASAVWAAPPSIPDAFAINVPENLCPQPERGAFDSGLDNAAALTSEFYRLPPCGGALRGVSLSAADPAAAAQERATAPITVPFTPQNTNALDLRLDRLAELGGALQNQLPAPLDTLDAQELLERLLAGLAVPSLADTAPGSGALPSDIPSILEQLGSAPDLQQALIGMLLIETLLNGELPATPEALTALIRESLPATSAGLFPDDADLAALSPQALTATLRNLVIRGLTLLAGTAPGGAVADLPLPGLQLDDIVRLGILDLLATLPADAAATDGLDDAFAFIRALVGIPATPGALPTLDNLSGFGLFGLVEALAAAGTPLESDTLAAQLAVLLDAALSPLTDGLPLAGLLQDRVTDLLTRVTSGGAEALNAADLPLLGLAFTLVDPAQLGDSPFASAASQVQAATESLLGGGFDGLLARSLSDLQADGLTGLVSALGGDPADALEAFGGALPRLPVPLADINVQQLIVLGVVGLQAQLTLSLTGDLTPSTGNPDGLGNLPERLAESPAALGLGIVGRLLAQSGALGDSFRDLLDGITQGAPGQLADLAPADLQLLDLLNLALLGLDGTAPDGFPGAGLPGSDFPAMVAGLLDFFGQSGDTPLVVAHLAGADSVLVIDLPGIDPPAPLVELDLLRPGGLLGLNVLGFDTLDVALLRLGLLGQTLLDQPLLDLGAVPEVPPGTPLVTTDLSDTRVLTVSLPGWDAPVPLLDIDLLDNSLAAVDVLGLDLLDLGILRLALLGQELQGLGSLADGLALLDLATNPLAGTGSGSAPLVNLDALGGNLVQILPYYGVDQPLIDVDLLGAEPLTLSLDGQELLQLRLLGLALLGRDLLGTGSLSEAANLLSLATPEPEAGGPLVNVGALNGDLVKLYIPNRGFENPLLDIDLLGDSLLDVDLAGRQLLQLRLLGLALLGRELLTPNGLFNDSGLLQTASIFGNLAGPNANLTLLDGLLDSGLLPGSLALPTALGSLLQLNALDGGLLGGSGILGTAIGDGIIGNGLLP